MSVGRAEDARLAILIDPRHGIRLAVLFAHRGRERPRVRPQLFDHVEFIRRRLPVVRDSLHDGMRRLNLLHRVTALMIMPPARHPEEFPPVIHARRAIGVHGAMDHHRRHARLVRRRDLADVICVRRVRKTLVMHHHVVALRPIRVVVKREHRLRAGAALLHDLPLHGREPAHGVRQRLALEFVIVATPAGDEQRPQRLRRLRRHCR